MKHLRELDLVAQCLTCGKFGWPAIEGQMPCHPWALVETLRMWQDEQGRLIPMPLGKCHD